VRRPLLTLALLAAVVGAWQGIASLPGVDDLTLASPVETVRALGDNLHLILTNTWTSLAEVLLGLLAGMAIGTAAATGMHVYRPLRDAAYPLLIASQAIPIPVVSIIFVLAFDYGVGPKVAIVALICFFPIAVNLADGLRGVDDQLLKLARSMGASRLTILRKIELPSAVPELFTGLRIAATVAVIGAVFGEWAGAEKGLGHMILLDINQLETPRVYAAIVILMAMSLLMFVAVSGLQRLAAPWSRS
jgi:ABC-type nitrate/sulfonate/bicarbonate transport system permease component